MEFCKILIIFTFVIQISEQLKWKVIKDETDDGPSARGDAGIGYDTSLDKIVLFGGRNVDILDDTWIYDLISNQWREVVTQKKPKARFLYVYGTSNRYFYVASGEGRDRVFLNDIWRFNIETETWEELPSGNVNSGSQSWDRQKNARPAGRYGAAGGIYPGGENMYVSHGFDVATGRFSDTYKYSMTEKIWYREYPHRHPYTPDHPHARCLQASTMVSPYEFVIFGGCLSGGHSGGPCPSGDSWHFNGLTRTWKQLKSCPNPRIYTAMAMLPVSDGRRIAILFGGKEVTKQVLTTVQSPADQVGILNVATMEWSLGKTEGEVPSKRADTALVTAKGGIYMFGGEDLKTGKWKNDLYLLEGSAENALSASSPYDCNPTFFNYLTLHGIFMVLGWGFFLQWGAFIARYFRHLNPLWFNLHKLFQCFGILLALVGFGLAIQSVLFDHFKFLHGVIGITLTIALILQPLNAVFRPHAPKGNEPKPLKRVIWEFFHKNYGRIMLVTAFIQISLGVFLAVANVIVWILWFCYIGVFVLIHIVAEILKIKREKHSNVVGKQSIAVGKQSTCSEVRDVQGKQSIVVGKQSSELRDVQRKSQEMKETDGSPSSKL